VYITGNKGPLSVIADDNPLTSLEGLPDSIDTLHVKNCKYLTNLAHCPALSDDITIYGCPLIKDLKGLRIRSAHAQIFASNSGMTSFEGCPKEISLLVATQCKDLTSFDGFPSRVRQLDISVFPGCLMFLHEKVHNKEIEEILLFALDDDDRLTNDHAYHITEKMEEISDPFEFQDWCIENGYEEYL
jgi:hypothetical protein